MKVEKGGGVIRIKITAGCLVSSDVKAVKKKRKPCSRGGA
jgi:hypothetical protein